MKIIFHRSDLDGMCSGALVKLRFPDGELIPMDYGKPFPWESIEPGEQVYMVDFSLEPFSDMEKLNQVTKLVWIDHHRTAIESCHIPLCGIRETHASACEFTWLYLYGSQPMPAVVSLLGRYDTWNHEDPNVLPFQYRLRVEDMTPTSEGALACWQDLLNGHLEDKSIQDLVEEGKLILRYQELQDRTYAQAYTFETTILHPLRDNNLLRLLCLNRGMCNSRSYDSVYDPEKHDLMVSFCRGKDGQWKISLYSAKEEIDVGEIAKYYGGGGHQGAAGFHCSDPWSFLGVNTIEERT